MGEGKSAILNISFPLVFSSESLQQIRRVSAGLLEAVHTQQESGLSAEEDKSKKNTNDNNFDLSKLKSKELDKLAGIFKLWINSEMEATKAEQLWDYRY